MKILPEPAGHSSPDEPSVLVAEVPQDRPLSQAWITDELLEHTRRVWSQAYERVISEAEAIELLTNVKRFAEVLLKIKRRRKTE